MHVQGFLHKLLSSVMHKKRLDTLIVLVIGLITNKKLSVTELDRGITLPIQERSAIRRADRFIGNIKLVKEVSGIYEQIAKNLIGQQKRPKIIVDWSHIPNTKNHTLRAALVAKGRALTLYEEVNSEKKLSNVTIEKKFLEKLKQLLPEDCKPIIITDAGFRNPWFKKINELNWDYIGRIRGSHKYCKNNNWLSCKDLLSKATKVAKYVGEIILCKKNPIISNLYLLKGKRNVRKLWRKKESGTDVTEYRRAAREGWLLASSLKSKSDSIAKKVTKLYKLRMQIEEGFRDLKSSRYGFGFENAYSRGRNRIRILLLIAMIASLIAWLAGYVAEKMKLQYQFQVNSIKKQRVLSLFYLGCRVIKRGMKIVDIDALRDAVYELES